MQSANANDAQAVSSSSAASATTGAKETDRQSEVDAARKSPMRVAQTSAPSAPAPRGGSSSAIANHHEFVEQELIPPTSRISRLPVAVPLPQPSTSHPTPVAISAFQNSNNTYSSQDVHRFVNNSTSLPSSTALRTFGQPSNLETSVSSSSQPLSTHVLTHPIRRPRTSNKVFQSSKDLAAHYGIPQILPPAPRTNRIQQQSVQPQQPALQDFQTLSANYLNMLSKQPTENTMVAPSTSTMTMPAVTPAELEAPVIPSDEPQTSFEQSLEDLLGEHTDSGPPYADFLTDTGSDLSSASPEFRDSNDFMMNYYTPEVPGLDDFGTSPFETPFSDFLSTPLFADDAMLTSPSMDFIDDRPLFGGIDYSAKVDDVQPKAPALAQPEQQQLYTISPNIDESPYLDFAGHSFPSSTTTSNNNNNSNNPIAPLPRRSKATGVRKGITPEALLDEDAPTQPRKYTTPSATSRKEVPAVFQRKRARSTAFGDEEDQLNDELPLNPTEKDLIEQKRRQNTVAARRSRRRKLEQLQGLQDELAHERQEKQMWMTRALTMQSQLVSLGVPTYNYKAEDAIVGQADEA